MAPLLAPKKQPAGSGQGKGLGAGPTAVLANAGFAHLGRMIALLERIASSLDAEPDYDVTRVVGGTQAGATVQTIQVPRTLRHVEIRLTVDTNTPISVAVLDGSHDLTGAMKRHNPAGATSPSDALCSSSGSSVTVRAYLAQSGYFTILFTAAATTFANVRVRSLREGGKR